MYRVRSTDVWFNAPGIQVAYQPIVAPNPLAARQNVGNDVRMAGRHTATSGSLPTWSGAAGWTFNGSTQELLTGYIPTNNQSHTYLCKMRLHATAALDMAAGIRTSDSQMIGFYTNSISVYSPCAGTYYWFLTRPLTSDGVYTIAGNRSFTNGKDDGVTIGAGSGAAFAKSFAFGSGSGVNHAPVVIGAGVISSIILSPAHIAQYSRQMAYCHVNPDWNAWGRRRMYFYAPSQAAAIRWPGVGRGGPVGGSPGIRGLQ